MSKSVVVTGANSGIGLATASELARVGYTVFGTVRDEAKAATFQNAARSAGVSMTPVQCDVSDADSCTTGFQEIARATGGGPWAVVNNAGFAQGGAVEDVSDEMAREQLEINLVAPARVARMVLPHMRERGDGRIVNVSSIVGRVSVPMLGWYCASKHGLEALTNALRMEVSQFGIKVVLIEPGSFSTNIWAGSIETLPNRGQTAYEDAYQRGVQATSAVDKLPNPVWVARAIRLALASPWPLARYLVGFDAMAGTLADKLAPTLLSDVVKSRVTGLGGISRLSV